MPTYRAYPYRKRTYKRRQYKPRRYATLYPAVKSIVTSMEEKKHVQTTGTAFNALKNWQLVNICCNTSAAGTDSGGGIAQGSTETQRMGERVTLKRIDVVINIDPILANVNQNGSLCRVLIVHDREPHLGYPANTTVLNVANDIRTLQNLTYRTRFTIVKDFVHSMVITANNVAANFGVGPAGLFKFSLFPNKIMQFSGAAGVTANIVKNCYYIMVSSDDDNCCQLSYACQLQFTDN